MSSPLEVGQPAPDFTLQGWAEGEVSEYSLSVRRGQPVVLAFYPGDNTMVCTKQMCSYSDNLSEFDKLNAVVWGISGQDIESKKGFAAKNNLKLPLLADTKGEVAEAFGITSKLGPKRSIFVIDADGKIAWRDVKAVGLTYKNVASITKAIEAASH